MTPAGEDFRSFIAGRLGCEPPRIIEPGRFVRFPTKERRGDDAGWAKLFPDGQGGVVGCFRSGETWTWQAKREKPFSDDERRAWRERVERERKQAEIERERSEREAAERAKAIWDQAQPASGDHPYLKRKGIQPHGLRLYKGPKAIRGMRCDGALIVPFRNADGQIQTLEFISPEGEKRYLEGGKRGGTYFAIGKPGDVICIAEGFATGASLHEATGCPVRIAGDAGNLATVAMAIRAKSSGVRLLLCADNDRTVCQRHRAEKLTEPLDPFQHRPEWCGCNPGVTSALEAARAVDGLVAVPGLERDAGTDFNDLALSKGPEAIKEALRAAKAPPEQAAPPAGAGAPGSDSGASGLVVRRLSDIAPQRIRWLWPERIARGKLTVIAGDPGLGKSQVSASLAAIVTRGGSWPVDRTTCSRASVVILSAEDDAADTIRPRLDAAGADVTRCLIVERVLDEGEKGEPFTRSFNLRKDMVRLETLLKRIGDVGLVIIDPVTAYLGETDSHKNAEVRALLAEVSDVASRNEAAFVVVTHLNKGDSRRAMQRITGSLAFIAAARAGFLVAEDSAEEGRRLFLPVKNNIGPDSTGYAFRIERAEIAEGIQTSRIAWEAQSVTVSADEALASEAEHGERTELQEANEFLVSLLRDAPMPSKQIRSEAEGAGHSWATIRRAQRVLGIEAVREGGVGERGRWMWRLPLRCSTNPEDAHAPPVSTLGKSEHLRQAGPSSDDDGERF